MEKLISKIYDYIVDTTIAQNRLLDANTLYGDGSRFENNRILFDAVYNALQQSMKENNLI